MGTPDQGGTTDVSTDPSSNEIEEQLARISSCFEAGNHIGIGLMFTLFDAYQRLAEVSESTDVKMTGSLLNCYLNATDCEEVRACGHATETQREVCMEGDDTDHCAGNTLVECTDDPEEEPEAYDCAAAGLICGEGEYGADCGERTCNADADGSYCETHVLWECDSSGNVYTAEDCRFYTSYHCTAQDGGDWVCVMVAGGTCGEDPEWEGSYACVGTGPECDVSTFTNTCDGTTLVSCRNGREARFDCSLLGSAYICGADDDGSMACIENPAGCSLLTPETCSNGVITYCAAGQTDQLDCRSYGYSGCDTAIGQFGVAGYCTE